MDLGSFKELLGWDEIEDHDGTFVVKFDLTQMKSIRGMRGDFDHLFADLSGISGIPICYHVNDGENSFEYWTVDTMLHRDGGPARIMHSPGCYQLTWYQHGAVSRRDGPAIETAKAYRITPRGFHVEHFWDTLVREYLSDGVPENPQGGPLHIEHHNYRETYLDGLLDDPPGSTAIQSGLSRFTWELDEPIESRGITPLCMEVEFFTENHSRGSLTHRHVDSLTADWDLRGDSIGDDDFDAWVLENLNQVSFTEEFWVSTEARRAALIQIDQIMGRVDESVS